MIFHFYRRAFFILAALPLLAGCGNLLPRPDGAQAFYLLNPTAIEDKRLRPTLDTVLRIDQPQAPGALDGVRIALRQGDQEIRYYADVRWSDRLPRLMQGAMVETFERARLFKAVVQPGSGLRSDWVLETRLADFQASYSEAAPQITVTINATLRLMQGGKGPFAHRVSAQIKATSPNMSAIITAFDLAQQKAVQELMVWVYQQASESK